MSSPNGNSTSQRGTKRLNSLRITRDLTLGGSSTSRRTYKPTIPVRNKSRIKEEVESPVKENVKHNPREERGRGRGRGRGKREFVQIQGGVFAEGLNDEVKRKGGWGGREKREESAYVPKPKLDLSQKQIMTKEEEDDFLDKLMRDDFIDDGIEDEEELKPCELPMGQSFNVKKKKTKPKVKYETVVIKQEKIDDEEKSNLDVIKMAIQENRQPPPPLTATIKMEVEDEDEDEYETDTPETTELTPSDLFKTKSSDSEFIFFQFPDILPGYSPSTEEDDKPGLHNSKDRNKTKDKDKEKKEEKSPPIPNDIWSHLPEGKIGKLRLHQSGRVTLSLGDIVFNVESGTQVKFLQDLVAINKDSEPPSMSVLGHVPSRMNCTPDMDQLLSSLKLND